MSLKSALITTMHYWPASNLSTRPYSGLVDSEVSELELTAAFVDLLCRPSSFRWNKKLALSCLWWNIRILCCVCCHVWDTGLVDLCVAVPSSSQSVNPRTNWYLPVGTPSSPTTSMRCSGSWELVLHPPKVGRMDRECRNGQICWTTQNQPALKHLVALVQGQLMIRLDESTYGNVTLW